MFPRKIAGLLVAAAAFLSAVDARAQTDLWQGTTGLWGTATNWSAGVPSSSSTATFNSTAGSFQTSLTLLPSSTTGSLVFSSTGGQTTYTFDTLGTENANVLTIGTGSAVTSGITNSDLGAITFYNALTLAGAQTWTNNGGAMNFNGNVNLGSGSSGYALTVAGSGPVNIAGVIADGGATPGSLVYSGASGSTLSLSGANTYTGATLVNSGTLSIQSSGALGTAANTANTTVASGAVLQLTNNVTTANQGTLVLNGAGTGSGALVSVGGNNMWNSNVTLGSNTTIYSATAGDTLTIGNASATNLFTMGSNTVTFSGAGDTFINSNVGVVGDTGGLIMNGTGTLTLYGDSTYYTGATVVNAGTLALVVGPFQAGYYGIMGSLTIGTGAAAAPAGSVNVNIWSDSYTNQISPTSAVTINSDGALNVGASTTMGTLTLNGGQVNISGGQTVSPSGDITSNANSAHETSLISGGALQLSTGNFIVGRDSTLASDLTVSSVVSGTNLTKTGSGILTLTGANTYTGSTSINGGALSISADNNIGASPGSATASMLNFNGGTLATTSTFALNSNRGVTLNSGGGTLSPSTGTTLTYGGVVTGTGALTVNDAGTVSLTGANTYSGGTNLNGGTLSVGADANLGAAPGATTANSLTFNGGTLAATAGFTLNSNRGITVNSGGGAISVGSGTLTYGGLITGSGTLSVPGAGILDLTNNSLNFSGGATVTSGELEFAGTLPSIGTLKLGTGSTLFVNGSDLTVTNLEITGNAIIDFGSGKNILNAINFTVDAGATLTVENWTNEVDYFYAQNWSGVTLGTGGVGQELQVTFDPPTYTNTQTGWLSYDKEVSPAPEPATYGAILVGVSLLGVIMYRRKRPAA